MAGEDIRQRVELLLILICSRFRAVAGEDIIRLMQAFHVVNKPATQEGTGAISFNIPIIQVR